MGTMRITWTPVNSPTQVLEEDLPVIGTSLQMIDTTCRQPETASYRLSWGDAQERWSFGFGWDGVSEPSFITLIGRTGGAQSSCSREIYECAPHGCTCEHPHWLEVNEYDNTFYVLLDERPPS